MSAEFVSLVIDLFTAAGVASRQGQAVITPPSWLPDPADQMLIGPQPVVVPLWQGSRPQVQLVSTDSVGPQADGGWTYMIAFPGVPGSPPPFSFYLPFTGGATQYLSQLAQSPAVTPSAQYVPRLGGLPMLGELSPAVVELADEAVIAVNAELGNDFWVTLGGNREFGVPSNPSDGQKILIEVIQPESGGPFTPTFASGAGGWSFGSAQSPSWSATPGASDWIAFRYSARTSQWGYLGLAPGL